MNDQHADNRFRLSTRLADVIHRTARNLALTPDDLLDRATDNTWMTWATMAGASGHMPSPETRDWAKALVERDVARDRKRAGVTA